MRLLREMPEIESKIATGTLNLTNIGYAQAAFKAAAKKETPLCKEEKLGFLSQIENQSTRATQKLVAEQFGKEVLFREMVKPVSASLSILSIPVKDQLLEKIDELKGLLAHSHVGASTADLVEYAVDIALEKVTAKKFAAPRKDSTRGGSVSNYLRAPVRS